MNGKTKFILNLYETSVSTYWEKFLNTLKLFSQRIETEWNTLEVP